MIDDPEIPRAGLTDLDDATSHRRIWAPKAERVDLIVGIGPDQTSHAMGREPRGFFGITTPRPDDGTRYAYALDGGEPLPDPCSRWQPDGARAPSAVFRPDAMAWDEGSWNGIDRANLVIYELHVGTFTREGTFEAIIPRLAI